MCSLFYSINKIIDKYQKMLALLFIAGCLMLVTGCQEKENIKNIIALGISKQVYNGINVSCMAYPL